MITYDEFIANVNENDLAMLTEFVQGHRITAITAPEADALFAQAQRLFTAGLVWRVTRGYEMKSGMIEYSFDGFVDPIAAGYIAKACKERVILSRDPLPPENPSP